MRLVPSLACAAVAAAGVTGAAATHAGSLRDPRLLPVHGALLRGDVDGDGKVDQAAVHCRPGTLANLVVSTSRSVLVRRISSSGCGVGARVIVLAKIDRTPGTEVVVFESAGSVAFADIYTFRHGALVPMTIDGSSDGSFTYYGSATHDAGADCVRAASGDVIFSTWALTPTTVNGVVTRKYMRVTGWHLGTVKTTRFFPTDDHRRYGGFGRPQPFPSCAVSRGPDRY